MARRWGARQPRRLADHRRVPAADRIVAQRHCAPPAGGDGGPRADAGARTGPGGRRHADPAAAVLPPLPHAAVPGRVDPAGRRRADHRGNRQGLPGAGSDCGAKDQPGEATDQGKRRPIRRCRRRGNRRAIAVRVAGAVPDLQRGLHRVIRSGVAPRRAHPRSHPAHQSTARKAARRRRGDRALGPDAAHRRPTPRANGAGRGAGAARRSGPRPLGRRRHRGGHRADHRGTRGRTDRPLSTAGRDRRRARRGQRGHRTPTGCRFSDSTSCWTAWHLGRWSR